MSFLREPFVEGEAHEGDEQPVDDGGTQAGDRRAPHLQPLRRHVGRGRRGRIAQIAPRSGRLLTWSLAASAANDFLQAGFSAITARANELEQRTTGR